MSTYDEVMREARRAARPSRAPWVLVLLAIACGCGAAFYLARKLDAARTEAAAATAKMLDAQERLAAERTAKAELDQQRERLEGEKKELVALREELSRNVQAKDEALAKLQGTYDELQEKMKAEIAQGDIRLTSSGGRLKVDLVDKVLFDSGNAQISKRGEEVLSRVGTILARVEDKQIQVSGHTDDAPISPRLMPIYPTNWELSTARATNVVRFLQERAGVPPKRLVASGYGPYQPIAGNTNPTGRARNRRIEILLTPALDPTPVKSDPSAVARADPPTAKTASGKRARRR